MAAESNPARDERSALIAGVAAFGIWGLVPIYWKLLKALPAAEILAHRIVWTTFFLAILLSVQRRWPEVREAFKSRRSALYCTASGLSISVNWLLFIWAVNAGRVLETSLGYFMTPLINVLFGAVFLRERLTRLQLASVALAALGVLNLTFGYGRFPWIAVALCLSFGLYGLLRKQSGTAAVPGLFFETTILAPLALVYLLTRGNSGAFILGKMSWSFAAIVISSGVVTGLPLVWFGHAARHLRLTTLGFLQYLAPTGSFLLGVFLYQEPFTRAHMITFGLIWLALVLFTSEAILRWRLFRTNAGIPPLAESA